MMLDPVIAVAIRSIDAMVNVDTELTHPADRKTAIEAFEVLHRAGYRWDEVDVEQCALGCGWPASGAASLRAMARGVAAGHRFDVMAGGPSWRHDIVSFWEAKVRRDRRG
jgi:pantoate kinase